MLSQTLDFLAAGDTKIMVIRSCRTSTSHWYGYHPPASQSFIWLFLSLSDSSTENILFSLPVLNQFRLSKLLKERSLKNEFLSGRGEHRDHLESRNSPDSALQPLLLFRTLWVFGF
jgi:hypothetical protein